MKKINQTNEFILFQLKYKSVNYFIFYSKFKKNCENLHYKPWEYKAFRLNILIHFHIK